jgi:hypothetical protein
MKRAFALLSAAAFVVSLAAPLLAETKTVKGELVDVACHMKDKKGEAHVNCATSCAKKGGAVGVAAEDGVYTITGKLTDENNKELVPHMGHVVEVSGEVKEADGKKTIEGASLKMAKTEKTQ